MQTWVHKFVRLWRHRWSEGQVQQAFPPAVLQHLEQVIASSEALHSGQIRLCIEGGLPYSYIWRNASARDRAVRLFGKLGVWDTEHNNGVLIYLLMAEHCIEIVADRAVVRAVPPATWEELVQSMQHTFQQRAFAQGLEQALQQVSTLLIQHFPPADGDAQVVTSQQPDAPVVQGRFSKD